MSSSEYLEHIGIAEEYIKWESNATYVAEMEQIVAEGGEPLEKSGKRIQFGTAGLRGRMGPGYACMNDLVVLQTSQGLLRYAEKTVPSKLRSAGVLIGYDGRHNSLRFAEITAAVFLSQDIPVHLCGELVPTPIVPFGILELGCACGIMVTASHNPKDDNGYKVYWENGAQIIPPQDEGIAASILENLEPWGFPDNRVTFRAEHQLLDDPIQKLGDSYFKIAAERYCYHSAANKSASFQVCYTAMHGVGAPWVARALAAFSLPPYVPVASQVEPDPEFSTVKFPNPEEGKGALALAMETAGDSNCPLILANDPDADRLAVALQQSDGAWYIFSGNEIAALLADWAWVNWRRQNPTEDASKAVMVASTVSSHFIESMAESNGFKYVDTLTGFKWIGNAAIDMKKAGHDFLFGFEVEIGFLFGDMSFDKDGVRTAAIFYEMTAHLKSQGIGLLDHLQSLYKRYGFYEMNTSYFFCDSKEKLDAVFARLRPGIDSSYPTACGTHKVSSIRDVTTGYDSSRPDKKSVLPVCPNAHMITFFFENGAVCTLRNSGTEPKIKYYLECKDASSQSDARSLVDTMTQCMIDEFLQPDVFGLIPPKIE
eukprot:230077_1